MLAIAATVNGAATYASASQITFSGFTYIIKQCETTFPGHAAGEGWS